MIRARRPTGAVNQMTVEGPNYGEITHLASQPRLAAGDG